jgi:hypothetical protein
MADEKSNRLPRDERRAQLLIAALEVFTVAGSLSTFSIKAGSIFGGLRFTY